MAREYTLVTQPQEMPIWPACAPYSEGVHLAEYIENRGTDTLLERAYFQIDTPTLTFYHAPTPTGIAVLICPGGGYQRVVMDKEGHDIAQWLNSFGVTAGVLKYRLPAEGHTMPHLVPLADVQRAIRIMRSQSLSWGIQRENIGVMGFSAGGHLAAAAGTLYEKKAYQRIDAIDDEAARPDFLILMYAVISLKDQVAHLGSKKALLGEDLEEMLLDEYSPDLQVTTDTPETLLIASDDDATVSSENSIRFYLALKRANVPSELHIFRNGGHGYAIRQAAWPTSSWTALCENWLKVKMRKQFDEK